MCELAVCMCVCVCAVQTNSLSLVNSYEVWNMWTIVEVIYGFEGILICSDRTQCDVCFETKAFSFTLSYFSLFSLLSAALPALCERGWAPRSESLLGVCLWAAKCPSNEDNDGETASLAIFLMTADIFILSVTLRQEAGAVPPRSCCFV